MLESKKSITLSGYGKINNSLVVNLTASIGSDNNSGTVNQNIINSDLYEANKAELRKDIAEFQAKVYEVQDQMDAEEDAETAPTEA